MKLTLHKPPPLNKLYGTNKWGGKYLKKDGVMWRSVALIMIRQQKLQNWDVPVSLKVDLYTCRHQDNDSILKLLQDTLQEAGVFKDDYLIFELHVFKHKCSIKEERVEVEVDTL